jgi:hypothetical protein
MLQPGLPTQLWSLPGSRESNFLMNLKPLPFHPARAGVQVALVETLLDFGAAIEARGSARWGSPLMTALAFGYLNTAEALVRRGARVDNIAAAAGLGRLAHAAQMLTRVGARSDGSCRPIVFLLRLLAECLESYSRSMNERSNFTIRDPGLVSPSADFC